MLDRFERFSYAITEISHCWHRIATEEMRHYGLKGTHAVYLVTLARYPEGITAARLGEITRRDKADVSRAVTALLKKGIIHREENDSKTYRAKLTLTDEGRKAMQQVQKRIDVAVENGGRGMSEELRNQFYQGLEIIAGNLQEICKEGLPQD